MSTNKLIIIVINQAMYSSFQKIFLFDAQKFFVSINIFLSSMTKLILTTIKQFIYYVDNKLKLISELLKTWNSGKT